MLSKGLDLSWRVSSLVNRVEPPHVEVGCFLPMDREIIFGMHLVGYWPEGHHNGSFHVKVLPVVALAVVLGVICGAWHPVILIIGAFINWHLITDKAEHAFRTARSQHAPEEGMKTARPDHFNFPACAPIASSANRTC